MIETVGAVAIGRNEGERLRLCLASLQLPPDHIVYVDSGSIDDSLQIAREMGVAIVELDLSRPFTAARARNAGFEVLARSVPDMEWVQFIDGDCELDPEWLASSASFMCDHPTAAAACGVLRERYPEASVYNRLCQMEWDQPAGETDSCGGIMLFRASVFKELGGFDEGLIAGEEPDLCFRARRAGSKIHRLAQPMALHDAAMYRAGQWWRRAKRSGYADMEASCRRGDAEPGLRRRALSNFLWAMPLMWPLWPILWLRVARRHGSLYATHVVLGKVPHSIGGLVYLYRRWRNVQPRLIEHKS